MYNYGYRDYQPQAARFTTVDPIRDGNNWFAYVNNNPVDFIDLWGLDDMYSIYIKGSGRVISTYVPTNPNGSIDYQNIKTYTFGATNKVNNELNGGRTSPNVQTTPADGSKAQYYYPREFPNGTWDVLLSNQVPVDDPQKNYKGDVFIPTTQLKKSPPMVSINLNLMKKADINQREHRLMEGMVGISPQVIQL